MCNNGTRPPNGVNVSCILLTVPVVNEVVTVVNNDDCAIPKRTSLPSIFPIVCTIPADSTAEFP